VLARRSEGAEKKTFLNLWKRASRTLRRSCPADSKSNDPHNLLIPRQKVGVLGFLILLKIKQNLINRERIIAALRKNERDA
jgi:hypothetical protein